MSIMSPQNIIRRPVDTEKSRAINEKTNTYMFEAHLKANKLQIKHAVESLFGVKVKNVNTCILRGKYKRVRYDYGKRPNWKRAYVTLKEGESIAVFEGV